MVSQVIHQTNVGIMEKKNSMENIIITISMVTRLIEKPKFEGKCNKCKKQGHKASDYRTKSFTPTKKIVKAIFGWIYNT